MRLGQTTIVFFVSKILSSVIAFIATIFITRSLGAEIWGIYALTLSTLAWLKIGGKAGISSAITKRVSEGKDEDYYFSSGLAMIIVLFSCTALIVILAKDLIENYIGAPIVGVMLFVLFTELLRSAGSSLLKGQQLVHVESILNNPMKASAKSGMQVLAVTLGFGVAGLLFSTAIASILIVSISIWYASVSIRKPTITHTRSLFNYAKYSWLGNIQRTSFSWVDISILGFFVASSTIGVYSVAWSVASLLVIFSTGISTALFPKISKVSSQKEKNKISKLASDGIRYNGLLLLPGIVGAVLIGDRILLIYGEEFVSGTAVLAVLICARTVYRYQSQLVNVLNGMDKPDLAFRVNALFIIVNLFLNITLIWMYGWVGAAVATTVAAGISLLYSYVITSRLLSFELPLTEIGYQSFSAILMGLVIILLNILLAPPTDTLQSHLITVCVISIGAVTYISILYMISNNFRNTIKNNLTIPFQ